MESLGQEARYIRHGLNEELFWQNVANIRQADFCDLSITATLNILTVGGLVEFYQQVANVKKKTAQSKFQFFVDPTLLKSPTKLNILKFSDREKMIFIEESEHILKNPQSFMLSSYESLRLQIIQNVVKSKIGESNSEDIASLYSFLTTIDQRRNISFRNDFKRLSALWIEMDRRQGILNVAPP